VRYKGSFAWCGFSILVLIALQAMCAGHNADKPDTGAEIVGPSDAIPARPSIEQQRREAEKLVDEYLAPVPATEPKEETKKKLRKFVEYVKEGSKRQYVGRAPAELILKGMGTEALSGLREIAEQNQGAQLQVEAKQAIRTIEEAVKIDVLNSLRLLGWAAMDVLRERLEKCTLEREAARKENNYQKQEIVEERNLRLCGLWSATKRIHPGKNKDWNDVPPPEYFYGGRRIECPEGLEHVYRKLTPEEAAKSGGVAEEYCRKKTAEGKFVKEGPYALWGPSGEALEQGNFVEGERDGKWTSTSTVQIADHYYKHGNYEKAEVVGEPLWIVIDFDAADQQGGFIYCGLGVTIYEILGKEGEYCRMRYRTEIELSLPNTQKTWIDLLVPRRLGKRTFGKLASGTDFSSLQKYVIKPANQTQTPPRSNQLGK
jgi:hypothetical protein